RLMERLRMQEITLDKSLSDSRRSVAIFLDELAQSSDLLTHDWSVQELASACGLGVTRFVHYVRQLKDMTPSRFLNPCRLNGAASIVAAEPDTTITQVAMACGFSSSQYFATAFHQQFGISPSDFRAGKMPAAALQSLMQERRGRK